MIGDRRVEIIDDAIISSPHQVHAMLHIIKQRPNAKRRVFVFGDMDALGPASVEEHEKLAPMIEAAGFDYVVAIGSESAHLADKLQIPYTKYENVFKAAPTLSSHFQDNDLIVFKASGPSNFKHLLKTLQKEAKIIPAPRDWTIEG